MTSYGVVCKGEWEGEEVLGMRLTWNKRDITRALVPTDTPGVVHDRQHDPLGVPFFNGPTSGEDVFVPLDYIIGGAERAGHGWRMLMDCLSAGRGVSLPGMSGGGSQGITRGVSAYA